MKAFAYSASRPPIRYEMMSFVSASIAIHVHTSPAPSGAFFASATFACFA